MSPLVSPRPLAARLGPPASLVLALGLTLAGCDAWPRYANLPDPDASVDVDQADPADQVPVVWTTQTEADNLARPGADNGDPRGSTPTSLVPREGIDVRGVLRGIGFNADFEPPLLEDAGCPDARRLPSGSGDWAGDVDFYRLDVAEASVLCAEVALAGESLGWDLLLYPVDACGLPQAPIDAGDAPLGWNRSGRVGGWKTTVEAGSWAVLLAGYSAPSPVAEYTYQLGLSLVPASEVAPGSEICPALPAGGAE